jgi:hypothetical protein
LTGILVALWLSAVAPAAPPPTSETTLGESFRRTPERYRKKLYEILARREFRAVRRDPGFRSRFETPSFLKWVGGEVGKLWDRFWDWVAERLFREPPALSSPGRFIGRVSGPAAWALIAAAAVLLGLLVARYWQFRPRALPPAAPTSAGLAGEGMPDALSRPADVWARFAEDFSLKGEWRLALRAAYLELLVLLHERGVIRYEKQRTNGEYAFALARGPAGEPFSSLTRLFDEAWYGHRPLGAENYRAALVWVRAVDQATAPREARP